MYWSLEGISVLYRLVVYSEAAYSLSDLENLQ